MYKRQAGNYTRENFLELERAVSRLESGDLKKKTIKSLPTKRVDEIGSVARSLSSISVDLKNQMTLLAKQRNQFGSVLNDLGQGPDPSHLKQNQIDFFV